LQVGGSPPSHRAEANIRIILYLPVLGVQLRDLSPHFGGVEGLSRSVWVLLGNEHVRPSLCREAPDLAVRRVVLLVVAREVTIP